MYVSLLALQSACSASSVEPSRHSHPATLPPPRCARSRPSDAPRHPKVARTGPGRQAGTKTRASGEERHGRGDGETEKQRIRERKSCCSHRRRSSTIVVHRHHSLCTLCETFILYLLYGAPCSSPLQHRLFPRKDSFHHAPSVEASVREFRPPPVLARKKILVQSLCFSI